MTRSSASFSSKVLNYHFNLPRTLSLSDGVEMIFPFDDNETIRVMQCYFDTYYNDSHPRDFIFGINPGRFGSGITGIGFTDPLHLENVCKITNSFDKRVETSAEFIYEVIEAYGGVDKFTQAFYITSISPVGFLKDGKNYNYYDDKILNHKLEPFMINNIKMQLGFGQKSKSAICIGQGKNLQYLQDLNAKHHFFEHIHALPHPRWVMQYKRKDKQKYIEQYLAILNNS